MRRHCRRHDIEIRLPRLHGPCVAYTGSPDSAPRAQSEDHVSSRLPHACVGWITEGGCAAYEHCHRFHYPPRIPNTSACWSEVSLPCHAAVTVPRSSISRSVGVARSRSPLSTMSITARGTTWFPFTPSSARRLPSTWTSDRTATRRCWRAARVGPPITVLSRRQEGDRP